MKCIYTCSFDMHVCVQLAAWCLLHQTYSREQDKAEPVTGMQHYRPETWELNFDLHAFKRWRHVGSAQGLTNDTEIACFLLQQYVGVFEFQFTQTFRPSLVHA